MRTSAPGIYRGNRDSFFPRSGACRAGEAMVVDRRRSMTGCLAGRRVKWHLRQGRVCLPRPTPDAPKPSFLLGLSSALLPLGGEPVDHVPLHRAAVIEMHPPDRAPLLRFGDAAGDGPDPERAAAEAPCPVGVSIQLLQLHPVSRPIRRNPGDLLSAIVRRLLAYHLPSPLLIIRYSGVPVFRCSGVKTAGPPLTSPLLNT